MSLGEFHLIPQFLDEFFLRIVGSFTRTRALIVRLVRIPSERGANGFDHKGGKLRRQS